MINIIEETKDYIISHHTGTTRYTGCQCFGDCSCKEDFIRSNYSFYTVKKKFGKHKTTHHNTLDEVKERISVLMSVPNKKYHPIN